MLRAEVVRYLDDYVERFHVPVRCGVEAFSVEQNGPTYLVRTNEGTYEAENAVVATGLYQTPKIPRLAEALPDCILQIHSMEYLNPSSLPAGPVLVVGSGQPVCRSPKSCTIPKRQESLSLDWQCRTGTRRYRGKDINDWFSRMGMFVSTVEQLPSPNAKFAPHLQISGKNGGESLNLHHLSGTA
jgi:putative flavoprotein involved in K+ transport